jgi:ribosomal protein S18 acetylase RimI-like enzyme
MGDRAGRADRTGGETGADPLSFQLAAEPDSQLIADLVRAAYRGEQSRAGWTSEADLLDDERIDAAGVAAKISGERSAVLLCRDRQQLVGCCEVADRGAGLGYLGMLAVRPGLQDRGIGRALLGRAQGFARQVWGCQVIELTVIGQRSELIDWYVRRGFRPTGERRPFPYSELLNGHALREDLYFAVLARRLG